MEGELPPSSVVTVRGEGEGQEGPGTKEVSKSSKRAARKQARKEKRQAAKATKALERERVMRAREKRIKYKSEPVPPALLAGPEASSAFHEKSNRANLGDGCDDHHHVEGNNDRHDNHQGGKGGGASSRSHSLPLPFLEREHVMNVYDSIARQWHGTRYRAWPRVAHFVHTQCPNGSLIADIGCGNGKNLRLQDANARGVMAIGVDFSLELLKLCRRTPLPPVPRGGKKRRRKEMKKRERNTGHDDTVVSDKGITQAHVQSNDKDYQDARSRRRGEGAVMYHPEAQVVGGDATDVPLRGGMFDAVLSIAGNVVFMFSFIVVVVVVCFV